MKLKRELFSPERSQVEKELIEFQHKMARKSDFIVGGAVFIVMSLGGFLLGTALTVIFG